MDDSLPECSLLSRQHSYSESALCDLPFDHTADESKCSMPLRKATNFSDFLVTSTPPSRLVTKRPKSCGRVLTSSENIQQLEEKEEKKRAALKEKGERRKIREERKLQREAEKSALNTHFTDLLFYLPGIHAALPADIRAFDCVYVWLSHKAAHVIAMFVPMPVTIQILFLIVTCFLI